MTGPFSIQLFLENPSALSIPRQLRVVGDDREDVGYAGAPVEASVVDQVGADVAGDDRFFVDLGHGEDALAIALAQERRAVAEQAADQGIVRVLGELDRLEIVEELVLEEVDPFGDPF